MEKKRRRLYNGNFVTGSPEKLVQRRKRALFDAGISAAAIGRRLNVSRSAVHIVMHGKARSQRIENAMAEACGVTHAYLFPEWNGGVDGTDSEERDTGGSVRGNGTGVKEGRKRGAAS